MQFIYTTGGREKYFHAQHVGDCVTRAICTATGLDYKKVYDDLNKLEKTMPVKAHERRGDARTGIRKSVTHYYIEKVLGWHYVSSYKTDGTRLALTEHDLKDKGTILVQISKHVTCVKDGVLYDSYNCSEKKYYNKQHDLVTNTHRTVYGYWIPSNIYGGRK